MPELVVSLDEKVPVKFLTLSLPWLVECMCGAIRSARRWSDLVSSARYCGSEKYHT